MVKTQFTAGEKHLLGNQAQVISCKRVKGRKFGVAFLGSKTQLYLNAMWCSGLDSRTEKGHSWDSSILI